MAELFTLPARATDNNGNNLSGAKLFFYQTNTSTPQAVYTTSALSVAHSNPVEADSAGKFAAIYLDPALTYRAVLKTANEVTTIYDLDPVNRSLSGNDGADDIGFIQSGTGAVARTVQSKLRDTVSVKDFGAVGNGVANDTTSITAADATSSKKYAPAGTYDTTLASVDLDGPYFGEGQIRDVADNKRAPWFSAVKSAPASFGNFSSVETAFNGDLGKNQIAMEHRVTGATTLGQPTSGYLYRPETFPIFGYLYNESGHNQSTSGNDGRTGVAFQRAMVYQAGQGDAVCYNASAFVTGTRSGSTDFLANPAAVLFNGDIQGGQAGVYLNAGEFALRDGGFDVAGIGWVTNLYRTVATGAKGVFWAGFQAQSQGTLPANHAFGVLGLFNVGLEGTTATLGANNALISGKAGQRIYLNNASSNGRYTTSYNGDYIEYSSGLSGFNFVVGGSSRLQVNNSQITVNGAKMEMNNKVGMSALVNYANDAAAAAGGVAIGECYRNGSVVQVRVT